MSKYPVNKLVFFDIETAPGFFLIGFEIEGVVYQYQISNKINQIEELRQCLTYIYSNDFTLCGFNSSRFDCPVLGEVLENPSPNTAYETSYRIIEDNTPVWNFDKTIKSVDLMPLLPGRLSLKKCGVCMGHDRLQELPYDPHTALTDDMIRIVYGYNINDLHLTRKLAEELKPQLELRSEMSEVYGVDLRSAGDATIAEIVLCSEYEKLTGIDKKTLRKMAKQNTPDGSVISVTPPNWWGDLNSLANRYPSVKSVIDKGNSIFGKPIHIVGGYMEKGALNDSLFVGDRWYTMGLGGLHSYDGSGCWIPEEGENLTSIDITSMYPSTILLQGLHPGHWDKETFLKMYKKIYDKRLTAKREGEMVTSGTLKITLNGTFGKTSDKYSALYDPKMTADITVLGQLALLVQVAMLADRGCKVVSGNTDGLEIVWRT